MSDPNQLQLPCGGDPAALGVQCPDGTLDAFSLSIHAQICHPCKVAFQMTREAFTGELVDLLELLRFYAHKFSEVTRSMTDMLIALVGEERTPKWRRSIPLFGIPEKAKVPPAYIRAHLEEMKKILSDCDTPVSIQHIDELLSKLDSQDLVSAHDVKALQANIDRELRTRVFFTVPYNRREAFNEPTKGWEKIIERFPVAQDDIEEMNKCFALSRYTAAVFHSLLIVEHGVISLGHYIGVTDPKPGWEATSRKLKQLVEAGHNRLPPGLDFTFLEQSNSRVESMKMAGRNKVSHAAARPAIEKSGFTDFAAEEIIVACRSFMRHLAEGLP